MSATTSDDVGALQVPAELVEAADALFRAACGLRMSTIKSSAEGDLSAARVHYRQVRERVALPQTDLLRAEHVSGVRVEAGPSSPVVSPGPRTMDRIPEVWHLIQLYGKGSFGYLKMTATAENGRIHREDGRGDWEPFYDDEGRPAWFRVSREVAESWSSDEEEQLTAGDELALAAASVARLVPEGAERFRVQRAVRAWEEAW